VTELLSVGYVARAHGISGEVLVRTFDASSKTLLEVKRLLLVPAEGPPRTFTISRCRPVPQGFLLALEGLKSRNDAQRWARSQVHLYREDVPAPEEGEFFVGDLVGLLATSAQGEPLGKVESVQSFGPVPNLVIRSEAGEELLVPFADEFVGEVDIAGKRLVVFVPEWTE
jgi:16S rRNA processing protein RimM